VAPCTPRHADDLPGSLCELESALARRRYRCRTVARAAPGPGECRKRASDCLAARASRTFAERFRQISPSVFRRTAAADLDCACVVDGAAALDLRRADLRSRCLGPSASAEPDARSAAAHGSHLP